MGEVEERERGGPKSGAVNNKALDPVGHGHGHGHGNRICQHIGRGKHQALEKVLDLIMIRQLQDL